MPKKIDHAFDGKINEKDNVRTFRCWPYASMGEIILGVFLLALSCLFFDSSVFMAGEIDWIDVSIDIAIPLVGAASLAYGLWSFTSSISVLPDRFVCKKLFRTEEFPFSDFRSAELVDPEDRSFTALLATFLPFGDLAIFHHDGGESDIRGVTGKCHEAILAAKEKWAEEKALPPSPEN